MNYLDTITSLLSEASVIAQNSFETIINGGTTKGIDNNQVLTQTDLDISHLLVSKLKFLYPNHNIIDEESGVVDARSIYTWVVDPIDGTSNFANGLPMYGVMIGLLEKEIPIAGGVALPFFKELYTAEKGGGAFCNGIRIQVTQEQNLMKTLFVYALDGHQEDPEITHKECEIFADIALKVRNIRTSNSCFDLMMVARGRYAAWLNRTSKIWDNVAPQIIIEEAGGVYTDFVGNPIDYSDPLLKASANFTVCATTPILQHEIQGIVNIHGFRN